jgi:hypothetical protein
MSCKYEILIKSGFWFQKSPQNVTAVKGKVAQLPCKVLGLGNRTVIFHIYNQHFPKLVHSEELFTR